MTSKLKSIRDGYGQALLQAGKDNQDLIVLSADLTESTRAHLFKQAFPNQFFEIGVAEQNMVGIAAGLALSGKTVAINSYAVFCPGRTWDQVRINLCYQKLNVLIAGHHSGVYTGPDGATHQGTEDIAITRCLPNLTVIAPADFHQAQKATLAALKKKGPVYLRLTKFPTPIITKQSTPFEISKAQILTPGNDLTLVACGPIISEALKAQAKLKKQNLNLEIINCHTIKPIDKKTIINSIKKTKCLITLEDHQIHGGLGSAVLEAISDTYPVPTYQIAIKDKFGQSGQPDELWHHYQLSSPHIIKTVKKALGVKQS
jgi:transketolase